MNASYLEDHILITVDTKMGAYRFLQDALRVWNERHGALIDSRFQRRGDDLHRGTSTSVFDPELTSAALDDLTLLFGTFFAPGPVLWTYEPGLTDL